MAARTTILDRPAHVDDARPTPSLGAGATRRSSLGRSAVGGGTTGRRRCRETGDSGSSSTPGGGSGALRAGGRRRSPRRLAGLHGVDEHRPVRRGRGGARQRSARRLAGAPRRERAWRDRRDHGPGLLPAGPLPGAGRQLRRGRGDARREPSAVGGPVRGRPRSRRGRGRALCGSARTGVAGGGPARPASGVVRRAGRLRHKPHRGRARGAVHARVAGSRRRRRNAPGAGVRDRARRNRRFRRSPPRTSPLACRGSARRAPRSRSEIQLRRRRGHRAGCGVHRGGVEEGLARAPGNHGGLRRCAAAGRLRSVARRHPPDRRSVTSSSVTRATRRCSPRRTSRSTRARGYTRIS